MRREVHCCKKDWRYRGEAVTQLQLIAYCIPVELLGVSTTLHLAPRTVTQQTANKTVGLDMSCDKNRKWCTLLSPFSLIF